jgi:hypothetical protein
VFENRVLRKIFWSWRDEVRGEWRKLHNEELNDLHSSPNVGRVIKLRGMREVGHVARMGERRGIYRVLVGTPEGKRSFGRPRHGCENNIKMDIWYDIFNCNWVATRWQLFGTHVHTNNTGNVTEQTIHRTTQKIHTGIQQLGRVQAVPRLCGFYPGICFTGSGMWGYGLDRAGSR